MAQNKPERIILHHSLTDDGKVSSSFEAIKRYHVVNNGWSDIGYHLILEYVNNKLVWRQGRAFETRGAHTKEQNMNFKSIGICVVGNFDKDFLTDDHIQMILQKQQELQILFNRPMPLEFHRDYATYKSCPGKNITRELFEPKSINDTPSEWAKNSWFKASIKGVFDGSNPKGNLTREQCAVILDRLNLLN